MKKVEVGDVFVDNNGLSCTVVEYINNRKVKVKYEDDYEQYRSVHRLRNGFCKGTRGISGPIVNPILSKYTKVDITLKSKHSSILIRLFKSKHKDKNLSYEGSDIVSDWLKFESFLEWAHRQIGHDQKGWHIDKDILCKGNKIYGPDTCCFVPLRINILFTKREACRGDHPIGVTFCKKTGKYVASCKLGNGKRKVIRGFNSPLSAFLVYKKLKEDVIKSVAEEYRNVIDPRVYEAMVNYQVEITD